MGGLDLDGAETGNPLASVIWNQGKDNPTNNTPVLPRPMRIRQGSWSWPCVSNGGNAMGISVFAGATPLFGAGIRQDGTPIIYVGVPNNINAPIAVGIPGSIVLGRYVWMKLDFRIDDTDPGGGGNPILDLYVNGLLAVSYNLANVPAGVVYADRRFLNTAGVTNQIYSPDNTAGQQRQFPDGRQGAFNYFTNFGGHQQWDDLAYGAPSLLLATIIGGSTIAPGDVIVGPTGTITASDYDTASSFQAGAAGRIWGYDVTGFFSNGDALVGPTFAGTARVTAACASLVTGGNTQGLEPHSTSLLNWYDFPGKATANAGPNQNTAIGAPSNVIAAQTPPNPANYLENSTGFPGPAVAQTDKWLMFTNTLPTDRIGGVMMYPDARQTDASITHVESLWDDSTGANVGTPVDLPTSYSQCQQDVWAMRSDGTVITPADVNAPATIGITLSP